MMSSSGPLSRLPITTDLLHIDNEDSISWTYVDTTSGSRQDCSKAYTQQGGPNKRKRTNRTKKHNSDIKHSDLLSDSKSLEWTEEEDLSLCQAAVISLQNSFRFLKAESEMLGTGPACSQLSLNIGKQLQRLSMSRLLAECFVPRHEHPYVVARLKSSTFRRTFQGFLENKAERTPSLIEEYKSSERNRCPSRSEGDLHSKDKESVSPDPKSSNTIPDDDSLMEEHCAERKWSPEQHELVFESKLDKNTGYESASVENLNGQLSTDQTYQVLDINSLHDQELRVEAKTSTKCETRSKVSARLKIKQCDEVKLASWNSATSGVASDLADDQEGDHFSMRTRSKIDKDIKLTEECVAARTMSNDKFATDTAKNVRKRKQKYARLLSVSGSEDQARMVSIIQLDEGRNAALQRNDDEEMLNASRLFKRNKSGSEIQTVADHSLKEQTNSSLPLAADQPLKMSQHPKNEKRKFKSFRKKFLDRCLEVQHCGMALTAKIPSHRWSENPRVHGGHDDHLVMQNIQQNRKNILDACLMVQKDIS